jgi:hypothetical protein
VADDAVDLIALTKLHDLLCGLHRARQRLLHENRHARAHQFARYGQVAIGRHRDNGEVQRATVLALQQLSDGAEEALDYACEIATK